LGKTLYRMSKEYEVSETGLKKIYKRLADILEPHTFTNGRGHTLFTPEGEKILTDGFKKRDWKNKYTEKEVVELLQNLIREQHKISKQNKDLIKQVNDLTVCADELCALLNEQNKTPAKKPPRLKRPPQRK